MRIARRLPPSGRAALAGALRAGRLAGGSVHDVLVVGARAARRRKRRSVPSVASASRVRHRRVRTRARGGRPPVTARGGPRAFVLLLQQRGRRRAVHVVVGRPGRGARRGTAGRERALARAVAPPRGGNVRAFADARGVPRHPPLALGVRVHHARLVIVVDVVLLHRVARVAHRRASLCAREIRPPRLGKFSKAFSALRASVRNGRTFFFACRDVRVATLCVG